MRELSKNTIIGLSVLAISTLILSNFFYKRYTNSATAKLAVLSEQTDSLLVNSAMLSIDKMTDTAIISLTDSDLAVGKNQGVNPVLKTYSEPILEGDKLTTVAAVSTPVEKKTSIPVVTVEKQIKEKIEKPITLAVAPKPVEKKVNQPTTIAVVDRVSKEKIEKPITIAVAEKEAMPIERESPEVVSTKNVSEAKYYVIVGTFQSKENAELELKKAPDRQLSVFKDGKYFRVSAGDFPDKKEANNVAKSLNTEGVACFVIQR
jgi:cell division septation protein DedD